MAVQKLSKRSMRNRWSFSRDFLKFWM